MLIKTLLHTEFKVLLSLCAKEHREECLASLELKHLVQEVISYRDPSAAWERAGWCLEANLSSLPQEAVSPASWTPFLTATTSLGLPVPVQGALAEGHAPSPGVLCRSLPALGFALSSCLEASAASSPLYH